ncbi:ARM repeat-containing protein [Eremomyces bilateralis CBS 781.70]|uniref:ARM repeat-containing protein n=1 Tax=Eremomyces bilateralis CBS 781.70 TaxID=1392243 RepID=A0A6G1G557_9PEZI|nr:ARM repeat-containing protein [Eremomyces bilateralis CBS 781.70]KAF1813071.1 ARM repeat-containing protein [Eremomyces bilateralis CBS 781.70]
MDGNILRGRIAATLDPNADIRRQAEIDLKYAEENPGFADALLSILDSDQDTNIRLSAVIYLKNRVTKGWAPHDDHTQGKPISEEEKNTMRQRLVPVLVSSSPAMRAQLVPTITKMLTYDFPQQWPNFLDLSLQLLNGNDANSVFAGALCLLSVCKVYRFKAGEQRQEFEKVVEVTFPHLLNIGNKLVNEESSEAGEILHTIVKCYKHAIYFELPAHLQQEQVVVGWCTLFLTIVSKPAPAAAMVEDLEERALNHWWKAKKWSYANLNRLFARYGTPGSVTKGASGEDYTNFAKTFITNFAPEILKAYFQQIEQWVAKTVWLSKPCLSFTLAFMAECIKPKSTWKHLKPHLATLIEHLLFPVLCQSDEDIELFETDPQEYLHRKLNFYEEVSAPDVAAVNFLLDLTKNRRKQTFAVLEFVNSVVNKYEAAPDNEKDPRAKEGALRMIGTLAPVILGKKSPIADQVEYFFVRHVFPEFRSDHGFLRARACDTLEKFERLDFQDPNNLLLIYRNILESMADPELPVRVEAALALQPLIRHVPIRTMMQQNIPHIMQQLLKLANEVDVDALTNVMEEFVDVFAAELTPFAVALCEQLRDTYLRIVRELVERNQSRDPEDYGEFLDDKSITALGVLQTIGTLILTLESTPEVLLHLETILMPVIEITLENKLYDLYNEVFEIIDSCTFAAKSISPTMWHAFLLIHRTFKSGAELYLEDMLPALENYVTYGAAQLVQNKDYLDAIIDIPRVIFKDEKVGGVERICGCKIAEVIMLSLRGHVDAYVPEFIQFGMMHLLSDEPKVKSHRVHLMEMVINGIYYNPLMAMQVLEGNGWTNKFFSIWFSSIDNFSRVHDKKLCIAAITSLLTLPADHVPVSVQQGWPRLLQGTVRLFQTLPTAMKNREEAKQEESFELNNEYDDDDDEEWVDPGEWDDADEGEDVKDEGAAYLEFLHEEAEKFKSEDDDELEEESLLETPLDKLEPYGVFKSALLRLQQEQPQLYDNLTKSLTPEEQQVIQGAVVQADQIAAAEAEALALAQQQAQAVAGGEQGNGQVGLPSQ